MEPALIMIQVGHVAEAVEASTSSVDVRDKAAARLALAYASAIDAGGDLAKLGPPLLAALEALQLSPRARKAVARDESPTNPLDQLAQRRARKGAPPGLDAGSS